MIQILTNFGQRIRHRGPCASVSVGCKPTLTARGTSSEGSRTVGTSHLESVNKSANSLRVANPQGLRYFLSILLVLLSMLKSFAQEELILDMDSSIPSEDKSYSSLSSVKLSFDFSNLSLADDQNYGLEVVMTNKKQLQLYKGTSTEGELLTSVKYSIKETSADFKLKSNTVEIPLGQEIVLEEGQLYTLVIPAVISLIDVDVIPIIADYPGGSITFYGDIASGDQLVWESTTPAVNSAVESLNNLSLDFNQEIFIAAESKAQLFEGDRLLEEAIISKAVSDPSSCIIAFNESVLYQTHKYKVVIPEGSIQSTDGVIYPEISIDYSGSAFKGFSYGRINPRDNSEVSYLAQINVPVNCADTEFLGRDFKAIANLYQVVNKELVSIGTPISCIANETSKGFYINIYDFSLSPAATYQIEIEANQFCLWSTESNSALKDTGNEKLLITYTTPVEITPLPTQEFGLATPSEEADQLESFKLMFEPYTFEDTFYYPVFASSSLEEGYNLLQVIDENTGENVASFEVDIKWDNDNNYWLENVNPLDIPLLEGHTYNVVVPAGMFCCRFEPLHDVTLNDEYTVTLKGAYKTSFTVSCNYGDAITISNVVNRGEETTLTFNPSEDWSIKSVLVNDEEKDVENNVLVLSDVTEDTDVYVTYSFSGGVTFDYTTGVDSAVADCPYSVSTEPGYVIISKVDVGTQVEVYNTVGMLMASSEATESILKIGVNPGIVVMVIRNGSEAPVGIKIKVPES